MPEGLEYVSSALQSIIHGGSPFDPLEYGRVSTASGKAWPKDISSASWRSD